MLYLIFPLLYLAAIVIAPRLIRAGWRGQAIDDHPVCKKCGFDLSGKPPESVRCSECGEVLTPDAVEVGNRVKRRPLIIGGIAFLLIGVLAEFAPLSSTFRNFGWLAHAPFSFLAYEAKGSSFSLHASLTELQRRLAAGKLSQPQIDTLADMALAKQRDLKQEWVMQWSDFLEKAQTTGHLSPARWQTYAQQSLLYSIKARPVIRRGAPWPIEVEVIGRNGMLPHFGCVVQGTTATAGNQSGRLPAMIYGMPLLSLSLKMPQILGRGFSAGLPEGASRVQLSQNVDIKEGFLTSGITLASLLETNNVNVTVLPAGQSSVTLKPDPSALSAIQRSITTGPVVYSNSGPFTRLEVTINVISPPVDVAFAVYARNGTKEWRLGEIPCKVAERTMRRFNVGNPDFAAHPDPLDLILRPDVETAEATVDINQIWDGELTLKNVPVSWTGKKPGNAGQVAPGTTTKSPAKRP
ncbi:MAG: hypothetical protein M3O30_12275 [Planctomycetota bacterium]|nr:hypothetical protein [Planctomycetota bacterium]